MPCTKLSTLTALRDGTAVTVTRLSLINKVAGDLNGMGLLKYLLTALHDGH